MPSKPPSKKGGQPSGQGVALPKPTPPPSKTNSLPPTAPTAPASVSLPKPKPPPSKSLPPPAPSSDKGAQARRSRSKEDAPEVIVGTDFSGGFAESGGPVNVLPGGAAADLDWDDHEESTSVYDRQDHDLFEDLGAKGNRADADDTARRAVASAAVLLKQSGGAAQPVSVPPPAPAAPAPSPVIPAPAPVPREMAPAPAPVAQAVEPRVSYTPSLPPPAAAAAPSRLAWVFAALAVVALLVAGGLFFFGKRTGDVTIQVTRSGKPIDGAQVFVDGQKRCDFTPCVIEGMTPGAKSIRVTYAGSVAQQQNTVEAGQKHQITITLDDAAAQPTASVPEPGKLAGLKVNSDQKGVKLLVNGADKGTLPGERKDLDPGSLKLRFAGDPYAALERTVDLKPGETLDLGNITLSMLKVKVTFKLDTAGAKVKLAPDGDKKLSEELDFRRDKEVQKTLDTTKKWTVEGTKKGFQDFSQDLAFADGKPEQTVHIELTEEGKTPPPVAATSPTPPSTAADTGTATKPETPPPSTGGMATLSINSVPPSKAIVDGRPVGSTPTTVQVPAGSHTVVFMHKDLGRKSVTVTVGAGETKVAAVRFKKKEE